MSYSSMGKRELKAKAARLWQQQRDARRRLSDVRYSSDRLQRIRKNERNYGRQLARCLSELAARGEANWRPW